MKNPLLPSQKFARSLRGRKATKFDRVFLRFLKEMEAMVNKRYVEEIAFLEKVANAEVRRRRTLLPEPELNEQEKAALAFLKSECDSL